MEDYYSPKSDFVALAATGDISLAGSRLTDGNLSQLIGFTRDADKSNRDWATMALGMYGPDTPEVTEALIAAAHDEDCDVRAEAIEALARRKPQVTLSLVERELTQSKCGYGVFEAAGIIADPCLVEGLKRFLDSDSYAPWADTIREAIAACETSCPVKAWIY